MSDGVVPNEENAAATDFESTSASILIFCTLGIICILQDSLSLILSPKAFTSFQEQLAGQLGAGERESRDIENSAGD
ncbi:hypothetical protein scyTo_0012582 [Scyliorhinus torazame]|uniref:Uncharacterized protein n=1 Tax=Scyliorhinus torazame TaxID=75743 RepID=A0A401NG78_SCYTO|nr:hypothetical protein [Scyliorhinus torazame]